MAEAEKIDIVTGVGVTAGILGIGLGTYLLLKKPPKEVEEGEWAEAGTILANRMVELVISEIELGWRPANTELASKSLQIIIREPMVGDWRPANTELASQKITIEITEVPITPPPGEFWLEVLPDIEDYEIFGGWATKEPDKAKYTFGEIVKLTAYPVYGWRFTYWDVDGQFLDSNNPINFMVTADQVVTAHFE